jgi:hypothetical protein
MVTYRLRKLGKAVHGLGVGRCRVCYGHPVATVHVMYAADRHSPGFRKTGDAYLVEGDAGRVTDGLRCRACGAEADQLHLMTIAGVDALLRGGACAWTIEHTARAGRAAVGRAPAAGRSRASASSPTGSAGRRPIRRGAAARRAGSGRGRR